MKFSLVVATIVGVNAVKVEGVVDDGMGKPIMHELHIG